MKTKKEAMLVKRHYVETNEEGMVLTHKQENVFLTENNDSVTHYYSGLFGKLLLCREPDFSNKKFEYFFLKLIRYLSYGNKLVMISNSQRKKPLSDIDIMKIFDCKKSTYYSFMKECFDKGFLAKYTYYNKLCYIMNPAYAYTGSCITLDIFALFEEDLSFLYSLGSESKKELYKNMGIDVDDLISKLVFQNKPIYSKKLGEGVFDEIVYDEIKQSY